MAEEVGALSVRLEATAARFERDMQRATRSMDRAAGRMTRRADSLERRLENVGSRFGVAIPGRAALVAGAVAGIGLAIREVVRAGDRMKMLEGQFTALTGSAERAEAALAAAFDIADEVGVAVDVVGNLQARFLLIADEIGATDGEVATLTQTLLKMGRIGGSSATEISSASIQLSQGLAAGALRGEELNSILENMPLVARAIAEEFGVGVGALKQMGSDGELVANRVLAAILNGAEKVNGQFEELPQTVDMAGSRMQTAFMRVAAELDETLGLSNALVGTMNAAADAADRMADALDRTVVPEIPTVDEAPDLRAQADALRAEIATLEQLPSSPANDRNLEILRRELRMADAMARAVVADRGPSFRADPNDPRGFAPPAPPDPMALDRNAMDQLAADLGSYQRGSGSPYQDMPDFSGGSRAGGGAIPRADDVDRSADALRRLIDEMKAQEGALGKTGAELARYQAEQDAANAIAEAGSSLTEDQREALQALAEQYVDVAVSVAEAKEAMDAAAEAQDRARRFGEDLAGAFADAARNADSFDEAVKRLIVSLAELALKDVVNNGANSVLGSLFSSVVGSTVLGGFGGSGVIAPEDASLATIGSRYANGTSSAPGGLALVGERGPEVVDLPMGSSVMTAARSRQMMSAATQEADVVLNYAPTINVQGEGGSDVNAIRQVLAQDRATFRPRVIEAVRSARAARQL